MAHATGKRTDTSLDEALDDAEIDAFVARWSASGSAERANYQLFLSELCDLLGAPRPDPTRSDDRDNAYVFERAVTFHHGDGSTSSGRIDLYKRGCFVLEAKQGSAAALTAEQPLFMEPAALGTQQSRRRGTAVRGTAGWDEAMERARGQAEQSTCGRCRRRRATRRSSSWWTSGTRSSCTPTSRASARATPPSPTPARTASPWPTSRGPTCASGSVACGPTRWAWTPPAAPPRSRAKSPTGWRSSRKVLKRRATRPTPSPSS